MALLRWAALNAGTRTMQVTVTLFDGVDRPIPWGGCPPNVQRQLTLGAGPAYAETTATGGLWFGFKVGVQIQDVGAGLPAKWVFPSTPLGTSKADNVRDLRVYLEADPAVKTNVLATVWGLDGMGAWWLLSDRKPVDVT